MLKPPKVFLVGNKEEGADFSKEEIDALIYKIALWFSSKDCSTDFDDPVQASKDKVRECLLGLNAKGEPWKGAPHEFAKRIKSKCNFDIVTEAGIPNKRNDQRVATKAHVGAATEAAEELDESNPVAVQFDQEAYRKRLEQDTYGVHPELNNPAIRPHVESYSLLMAQRKVIDGELAMNPKGGRRDALLKSLKNVNEMADGQMKMLGIHPDQIRRSVQSKSSATVSDLVEQIENDDDFKKREKTWALQLALQLFWMSEHYNGRKTGPQLSDFEIWHMTRTRPIRFRCRHGEEYTLVEGFSPNELRDWLLKEGVLVEEPVIPHLFTDGDLEGLATADLEPKAESPA
jgi:hypothetical protein